MSEDLRVSTLLHQWREQQLRGEPVTPEELCRDCPELLAAVRERVGALKSMEAFLGGKDTATRDFATPSASDHTREFHPGMTLPAFSVDIPGYEVLDVLGRGGMGVVYKARQVGLNRLVALKMILSGAHAGPEERARFQTEAEAVARLRHANVIQVYEIGRHDGLPFLSLEYVEGGSLDRRLAGTPLAPNRAAELVETLARAVQAAHEQGIVHRDLKPANVLLTADGIPKIADFGLAKQLEQDRGQTGTGAVYGTPSYMAPEQAAGLSRDVGPAADVYALGAILYETLTGRPPFKGATQIETVEQVRRQEPVPPRQLQPKVPRDLETICLKCLQKAPPKRYASAAALADDLRRFLAGEAIRARPAGLWERAWKWARRRPAAATLLAVSTLAVAVVLIILTVSRRAILDRQRETEDAVQRLLAAQTEREAARRDEQRVAYHRRIALAQREWLGNRVSHAIVVLEECPADLRAWEWHYLRRLCAETDNSLGGNRGVVRAIAFQPASHRLGTASEDGSIRVWDLDAGRTVQEFRGLDPVINALAYSPDGRTLASAGNDRIVRLWDATTELSVGVLAGHDRAVYDVTFAPSGRQLATASGDRTVRVWDLETGEETVRLTGAGDFTRVAFHPTGERLAAACNDRFVRVWDAAGGREELRVPGVGAVAFSPDGAQVAAVNSARDFNVTLWDARTGQPLVTLAGHTDFVRALAFSHADPTRLATAAEDNTVRVWRITPQAGLGEEAVVFRGHDDRFFGVAFSPDGSLLAAQAYEKTVRLWQANQGQEHRGFAGHRFGVKAVTFDPVRGDLASAVDGVIVRNPTTGRKVFGVDHPSQPVYGVAYDVQGRILVWAGMMLLPGGQSQAVARVHDATTGKELTSWVDPTARGYVALALSPDGRRLAVADHQKVIWIRDLDTSHSMPLHGHTHVVCALAFSPDGQRLVAADEGGKIVVWDPATGRQARTFAESGDHGGAVHSLALDREGNWLASAGEDKLIHLWDMADGRRVKTFRGHVLKLNQLCFSPDGRRLVSVSGALTFDFHRPGEIKLWDLETGHEVISLQGHRKPVIAVAFSRDGRLLATGGADGSVHIWDGSP